MSDTVFKRAGGTLKEHKGTIVGSVGGASIVGVLAFLMPLFTDMKETNVKQWERIAALQEKVTVLQIKVEMLERAKQ